MSPAAAARWWWWRLGLAAGAASMAYCEAAFVGVLPTRTARPAGAAPTISMGLPLTSWVPASSSSSSRTTRFTENRSSSRRILLQQKKEDAADDDDGIIEYDDFGDSWLGGAEPEPVASSSSDAASAAPQEEEEPTTSNEFDDFAGGPPVGDATEDEESSTPSSSTGTTVLQDRMQAVQQQERRHEAVFGRNWKLGHWQVRGFSLEDATAGATIATDDNATEDKNIAGGGDGQPTPAVCQIVPASTDDDHHDDSPRIWVGRTDGSVFAVQLGTDYLTKLGQEAEEPTPSAPEPQSTMSLMMDEDDESMEMMQQLPLPPSNPTTILAQLQAGSSPVTALVAASTADGTSYVFTATRDTGLQQWLVLPDDDEENKESSDSLKLIPSKQLLEGNLDDEILSLKAISLEEQQQDDTANNHVSSSSPTILLSADRSTLLLWDLTTGGLLGQVSFAAEVDGNEYGGIESVDTDGTHVYVGTSSGRVRAYSLQSLLSTSDSSTTTSTQPSGQWQASQEAVTALHCGATARMGSTVTRTLYTGDAEGVVKQWNVFGRPGGDRLEQWPKLPTQRLPQKAHLFVGHAAAVRAIRAVDAVKFVTAAADGTVRAWNAATGKELFRMDGFSESIRSLCLLDSAVKSSDNVSMTTASSTLLVTDGMDKYVCVHDFANDPDEDDTLDFESLDMPEYRD